jgi:hypothetical protein
MNLHINSNLALELPPDFAPAAPETTSDPRAALLLNSSLRALKCSISAGMHRCSVCCLVAAIISGFARAEKNCSR